MSKYFGTDGFRGEANVTLTVDHAFQVGRFLGWYYSRDHKGQIVIGKDTRRSSYMFECALAAGITASGADACLMHVTTTPSVSYISKVDEFDCGIMISASHNPFHDNGIKLINRHGEKMEQEVIDKIEAYLDSKENLPYATGADIGRVIDYASGRNRYIGYLISLATHSYKDMKVALDCANGSAWMIAENVFEALGAETHVINNKPDGININVDCGSTHIEQLCPRVVEGGYDLGIAFDGDADRIIAVDERGEVVDGDMLLAVFACYLISQDKLAQRTVVGTVMSNIGLLKFGEMSDVHIETTKVGDRYVLERMREQGYNLGGEQSGHITFLDYMPTGDAQLCAVQLLGIMAKTGLKLSELAAVMKKYPQVLVNVKASQQVKDFLPENRPVQELIAECEAQLGSRGRVLVRPSGTEPLIRVMLEGEDLEEITGMAQRIAEKIEESL